MVKIQLHLLKIVSKVMKTYKWLICSFPMPIRGIVEKLSMHIYDENDGNGFILAQIRENSVSGKFVTKKNNESKIKDPFGNENVIKFVSYETTVFTIFEDEQWLIEIENPGRSIKPFLNMLIKIFGFNFYIEELNINLRLVIDEIESKLGKLNISKIEVTDINIKNKGLGILTIKSQVDSRTLLENEILNQKFYKFKSFQGTFISKELSGGWIELKSNSSLNVKNIPTTLFLESFRDIIRNCI